MQIVELLLPIAHAAVIAMFALLAIVAVVRARRGGPAGSRAAAMFSTLILVLLLGAVEDYPPIGSSPLLETVQLSLAVAFPYLLFSFTNRFRQFHRRGRIAVGSAAGLMLLATLGLAGPAEAAGGELPRTYTVALLTYWLVVSVVVIVTLWRAGFGQPTVARRRMRLMSVATGTLGVALILAMQGRDGSSIALLAVYVAAVLSAAIFGLGFYPPRLIRIAWRKHEEEVLHAATLDVLRASTIAEAAHALLPPTAALVGAGGAALTDKDGRILATHGFIRGAEGDPLEGGAVAPEATRREAIHLGPGHGELIVWTSPYTPFFARDELQLLEAMAAIASLALDRAHMLAEEQRQRAELQRAMVIAERAHEEAFLANRAKTDFLSRMSHELRTPLNAVLGFGQILELAELAAEERDAVKHILKGGRHLLALINDVLDLSRIEAGQLTISVEPVDAADLIQDAMMLIRPIAEARNIRVTDRTETPGYVLTDRQRCRQVLLNLLSNAVKYNHDGGAVELRTRRLADEQKLRIAVRDTGPGIDPGRMERLFEPFDRLGAENSGIEGTGLGLPLSRQLIERLGGVMGVETEPGMGSTFWIDLPETDAPAGSHVAPRKTDAVDSKRHTLLLVEDNVANLRLVEAMLRRRPEVSVMSAMHGRSALDLAREFVPDVIVLDLHLPDIPGREMLHRLRADPRTRDIPVVIASADATSRSIERLRQEGAFAYVTKPLELQTFLETVDDALGERQTRSLPPHADGD